MIKLDQEGLRKRIEVHMDAINEAYSSGSMHRVCECAEAIVKTAYLLQELETSERTKDERK